MSIIRSAARARRRDLVGAHLGEVHAAQQLGIAGREVGGDLGLALAPPQRLPGGLEQRVMDARRGRLRRRRGARRLRHHQGHELLEVAAPAEEDAERLVEHRRVLVPLHQHGMQRPVDILAGADADATQRRDGVDHGPRPHRQPGAAQQVAHELSALAAVLDDERRREAGGGDPDHRLGEDHAAFRLAVPALAEHEVERLARLRRQLRQPLRQPDRAFLAGRALPVAAARQLAPGLLLLLFLLLVANGVFAMAEIAVVSARKARLRRLADQGNAKARTALELAESPNRFLSTVQIGITLVGIFAGAFGGATIAEVMAEGIARYAPLAAYSEGLALALVVMTITLLSLVIGELAPKRLALNDPERVALALAPLMKFLSRLAAPLVRLLNWLTEAVLALLRVRPSDEPAVTQDEIKVLIAQATQAGVLEPAEQEMLSGVIRLGDRRLGAVLTPRTEIEWLDLDDDPQALMQQVIHSSY